MRIDLDHLPVDGISVTEHFGAEDLASGDDERFEPVGAELSVTIRSEGSLIRVFGRIAAEITSECDRCLKPVTVRVDGGFDTRYTLDEDLGAGAGDEEEVDLSAPDVEPLGGPEFDTRMLVREQLALNLPVRVICSETCAGLCPVCRADRNVVSCDCPRNGTDFRWDALKQFRQ